MKKLNLNLLVDVLILAVLSFSVLPPRPVHAQLAAQSGFSYTNITSGTNTLVKSSNGTLHTIVIGSGTATFTVVDTSAANCTGGTSILTTGATAQPQVYTFDLQFLNGLCITSSAATNSTVTWR